jgi:predicted amidohydrolase YtcJ
MITSFLLAAVLAASPADLVLTHATVYTMDAKRPRAEAVAVREGKIVAVGTDAEIRALVGPKTRVVDLAGKALIPGFQESHGHLLGVGQQRMNVDLRGTTSYRQVIERMAPALKASKPGEWVVGRGWHEGKWTETSSATVRGFPTHQALSAVSPDNPVYLVRADGHAILVNAKAMAVAGVGRDTPVPAGGEIIRDSAGAPTGVLVDNAKDLVHVPPPSAAQKERALDLALEECLSLGITTFDDAGADLETIELYRRRADQGRLTVRVYAMIAGGQLLRRFDRPEIDRGNGFFTLRSVKLYADGALGSRGAALLEPYADDPKNQGLLVTPPEALLEATRYAVGHGFQVATHAIGDRGNRVILDVYEKALREHPEIKDARLRIEHAQILDAGDIPRFAALGVIASMQGIHATSDRPWAGDRLGMDRVTEGAYVWQKLFRSGARIVNGTDAPVEDLSAIKSFYASVTRQDEAGNPPGGFDPDQRMSREQALSSYTRDAAYGNFTEAVNGTIEVGKRADLVALTRDIMSVPDPEIVKAEVAFTIVGGRVLYERPGS